MKRLVFGIDNHLGNGYLGNNGGIQLIKTGILKPVKVLDTNRQIGIVKDFEAIKVDTDLGKGGINFSEGEIDTITELDDVFFKDLSDEAVYYIKDGKIYSTDGIINVDKTFDMTSRLYLENTVEYQEEYAIIYVTPRIQGITGYISYYDYASELLANMSEEEKIEAFIEAEKYLGNASENCNDLQTLFQEEYDKGWTDKLCTTIDEYVEEYNYTSFDEMLISWRDVKPKEYNELMRQLEEMNVMITVEMPNGTTQEVKTGHSFTYAALENGTYQFVGTYENQIQSTTARVTLIDEPTLIELPKADEDIYEIDSIEDLVAFSNNVNYGKTYIGKTVRLMRDLDFNDDSSYEDPDNTTFGDYNRDGIIEGLKLELTTKADTNCGFKAIGGRNFYAGGKSYYYVFAGTFDGQNYEISNMYQRKKFSSYMLGLFGENDGTIKNLVLGEGIIENTSLSNSYTGGIVTLNYGILDNLTNKITIDKTNTTYYIGGVVGRTYGNVTNCKNYGTLNLKGTTWLAYGGVVGYCLGADIIDCSNYADINIGIGNDEFTGSNSIIGGVVGDSNETSTKVLVNRCYNLGNISVKSHWTGGVMGWRAHYSGLINCYNLGDIYVELCNTSGTNRVGGVLGYAKNGYVYNSYNSGKIDVVAVNKGADVGGVVGDANCICSENLCNYGEINMTSPSGQTFSTGGVILCNYWGSAAHLFNFGNITSDKQTTNIGSIANCSYGGYFYNNKYLDGTWSVGCPNVKDTEGVIETCTLDDLSDIVASLNDSSDDTYIWFYEEDQGEELSKWEIRDGVNNGYPVFTWQD